MLYRYIKHDNVKNTCLSTKVFNKSRTMFKARFITKYCSHTVTSHAVDLTLFFYLGNLTSKVSWVFTALSVCTHLKWSLTKPRDFSPLSLAFLFIKVVNWTLPGVSMAEISRHPLRGGRCPQGITGALVTAGRALTNPLPERKIRVSWGELKSDQMLEIIFKAQT